jgi:DNA-binding NtrC family response regulator
VDDKELMRDSVATTLTRAGMQAAVAPDGAAAMKMIADQRPAAVITDLQMPGMTGLELLAEIRRLDEQLPVVLMTAYATVQTAVQAMKTGAFDYITKPFEGDQLVATLRRAVEHARLLRENAVLH